VNFNVNFNILLSKYIVHFWCNKETFIKLKNLNKVLINQQFIVRILLP